MFDNKSSQIYFNQVKGVIVELNEGAEYCSVTLEVGHDKTRLVNLVTKKGQYDVLLGRFKLGEKITCMFYPTSNKKGERWYSSLVLLNANHD